MNLEGIKTEFRWALAARPDTVFAQVKKNVQLAVSYTKGPSFFTPSMYEPGYYAHIYFDHKMTVSGYNKQVATNTLPLGAGFTTLREAIERAELAWKIINEE